MELNQLRQAVTTAQAAKALNRQPQTLRNGPVWKMAPFVPYVSMVVLRGHLMKSLPS